MSKKHNKQWWDNKNWWDENNKVKNRKNEYNVVVDLRTETVNRFTKMIRTIAMSDNVFIDVDYDKRKQRLDIYSYYDNVKVHTQVGVHYLISQIINMEDFVYCTYEMIKESLIYTFEEVENNQEHENDEHWEFLELWCI